MPSGLVIPGPARIRIRRDDPGTYGRYFVVRGSRNSCLITAGSEQEDLPALVVESDLDAILLAQELQTPAKILSTGSASYRPSPTLVGRLKKHPFVLLCYDNDQSGKEAARRYWLPALPNAAWSPVPSEKDPTEYFLAGHDLEEWFTASCQAAENHLNQKLNRETPCTHHLRNRN